MGDAANIEWFQSKNIKLETFLTPKSILLYDFASPEPYSTPSTVHPGVLLYISYTVPEALSGQICKSGTSVFCRGHVDVINVDKMF